MPSSAPTLVTEIETTLRLSLPIEVLALDEAQILVLQSTAATFIENFVQIDGGLLQDVVVTVMEQAPYEVVANSTMDGITELGLFSNLQSQFDLQQALALLISIEGTYIGTDMDFDLASLLSNQFLQQQIEWFLLLARSEGDTFGLLVPDEYSPDTAVTSANSPRVGGGKGPNLSPGATAAIVLVALAAMVLGLAASVYALRNYRTVGYEKDMSPRHLDFEEPDDLEAPAATVQQKASEVDISMKECLKGEWIFEEDDEDDSTGTSCRSI